MMLVLRGGGWYSTIRAIPFTRRDRGEADDRFESFGFRLARRLVPAQALSEVTL
jgi:formylglycine-generating enzyme required for sulfatase activity